VTGAKRQVKTWAIFSKKGIATEKQEKISNFAAYFFSVFQSF
jgi:hypothetical protein